MFLQLLLLFFVASYRHSVDLPDNAKPFKIGSWVVAQRKEKAMGRMDPEKVNLLQKLVEEGMLI